MVDVFNDGSAHWYSSAGGLGDKLGWCLAVTEVKNHKLFMIIIQDVAKKPIFRIGLEYPVSVIVQGCVGDTFEAAVPVVKQLYDAVLEGRIT